jgi:hypothetical protein
MTMQLEHYRIAHAAMMQDLIELHVQVTPWGMHATAGIHKVLKTRRL